MSFDDLCIQAYDNRNNLTNLYELWEEAYNNKKSYSLKENSYITFMFETYISDLIKVEIKKFNDNLLKNRDMQYDSKSFNPVRHERRKALTVKNPYAEYIAQGKKTIEVRSKNTKHRGELVICSSQKPEIQEMQSGCMLALVDLYDTKPLKDLTAEEWELTCIPEKDRAGLKGYGWFLKDPVRIIEFPVKGQLGIWNLIIDKEDIIPYNATHVRDLDVDFDEVNPYDRKAVKKGCFIILTIFVLFLIIVVAILRALFY